jgi:hypothetical protein
MRRRAPAGRRNVSYGRPHLIRIPHPVAPFFQRPPSMGIWTFDRNDGDALVELPTNSCIAMIEAPWVVRARYISPHSVLQPPAPHTHPHPVAPVSQRPPPTASSLPPAPPPGAWAESEGGDDMRDGR